MKHYLISLVSLIVAAGAGALTWAAVATPSNDWPLWGSAALLLVLAVILALEPLDALFGDVHSKERHLADRRQEMTRLRAELARRENEAARLKRQMKDFSLLN